MSRAALAVPLIHELVLAHMNAQLYGSSHARTTASADAVTHRVRLLCESTGEEGITLAICGNQLAVGDRPVLGASMFSKRLIGSLRRRGSGGVELHRGVTGSEVKALLEALSRRVGADGDYAGANAELIAKQVVAIRFLPPYTGPSAADSGLEGGADVVEEGALALHQDAVDLLQGVTIATCLGKEIDLVDVRACVDTLIDGLENDPAGLHAASRYPEFDSYTFGHSIRVCLLAIELARAAGTDRDMIARIGSAALLHDVGKALVPFEVLHKKGRLSPEELVEMRRHPVLGAGILLSNRSSDPMSVSAAYGHHLGFDGSGYPRTCGEYEQKTIARVVKICDVYEALTAVRPYKPPLEPERAYRVMMAMKGHFDPALLRAFMRQLGVYPTGLLLRMSDGTVARVIRQSADPLRPVIETVEDENGPVAAASRLTVDLSAATRPDRTIERALLDTLFDAA